MKSLASLGLVAVLLLSFLATGTLASTKGQIVLGEITLFVEQRGELLEGDLQGVPFHFTNSSPDLVILLGLSSPSPKPISFSWSLQSPGGFHLDGEVLIFNPVVQMPAFGYRWTTGLILPGESREWEIPVKFLQSGEISRDFVLTYVALDFEEFNKFCYIPYQDAPEELPWYAYRHPNSPEEFTETATGLYGEELIISDATYELAIEQDFTISFQVPPREFSIEGAFEAIGYESESYTFSQLLKAWVIETEEGTVLATEEGTTDVGRTTLDVFELVDETAGSRLEMVFPGVEWSGSEQMDKIAEELAENYKLRHHKGIILQVQVPKEDLISVLVYLAGQQCVVRVGDWYCQPTILVGPG